MPKLFETAVLVTEVIGDTKSLFELQLKLLRAEIEELGILSKQFALLGTLALAVLVPAVFFLGLALSDGLAQLASLPAWACHLLVCFLFVGLSLIPLLKARGLLTERKSVSP